MMMVDMYNKYDVDDADPDDASIYDDATKDNISSMVLPLSK